MSRPRAYRSIDEIMSIFKITLSTVNTILKKNKIDSFSDKWKVQINAKDFYKAYTSNINPSLFEIWNEKKKIEIAMLKTDDNANIFQQLFGNPHKNKAKNRVVDSSLLSLWDFI